MSVAELREHEGALVPTRPVASKDELDLSDVTEAEWDAFFDAAAGR